MGFTESQLRLERLSEIFSVSADRRGGVSPPSLAGELADCGAGFQPARAGKDARTTDFKCGVSSGWTPGVPSRLKNRDCLDIMAISDKRITEDIG